MMTCIIMVVITQDMADILSNVLEDTNDNGWLQLQRVSGYLYNITITLHHYFTLLGRVLCR